VMRRRLRSKEKNWKAKKKGAQKPIFVSEETSVVGKGRRSTAKEASGGSRRRRGD